MVFDRDWILLDPTFHGGSDQSPNCVAPLWDFSIYIYIYIYSYLDDSYIIWIDEVFFSVWTFYNYIQLLYCYGVLQLHILRHVLSDPKPRLRAQVAPSYTTENGIVRVQIRHPSSPLFPKPIGPWAVTGGPKNGLVLLRSCSFIDLIGIW